MATRSGALDGKVFDEQQLSYTSLRDLLPVSRPGSPVKQKREAEERCDDERLPIKNRLVEQAARAYLLPQKTPPEQFLTRYWARLSPRPAGACPHGCPHGCLSCLPAILWVDLTRVVHALFAHLRAPPLLSDRPHAKPILTTSPLVPPSLVTPSLVK